MAWTIYGLDGRPADYLVSSTLDSTMRKFNLKVKCGDRNAIFAARRGISCCRVNVLPASSFLMLTTKFDLLLIPDFGAPQCDGGLRGLAEDSGCLQLHFRQRRQGGRGGQEWGGEINSKPHVFNHVVPTQSNTVNAQ